MLTKLSHIIEETRPLSTSSPLEMSMLVHDAWKQLKGIAPAVKDNVRISLVKDSIVYMKSADPTWAGEIQLQTNTIVKRINQYLKTKTKTTISGIVILVGS